MRKFHDWFALPENALKLHGIATVLWLILSIPIAIFLNSSIPLLVFISVYAIVIAHWSSWQATRTEVRQAQTEETSEEIRKRLRKLDPDHPQDKV